MSNNLYWNLINEFYKISGVPVVLNTSFNLADEPNVCTPINALKTFYRCGMDSVVIGNYIIHKLDGDYSGPHPKPHLTSNIPVHPDV